MVDLPDSSSEGSVAFSELDLGTDDMIKVESQATVQSNDADVKEQEMVVYCSNLLQLEVTPRGLDAVVTMVRRLWR